ncbi:Polyhydroxyalkanoate synthesis regulator phasin [Desulfonatronum zhilinae]|nr:Polyhydroxyalkanoate synthesis regulator phasin [Desulfonatronum zhilinae]
MKPTDLLHIGLGAAFMAKEKIEAQLKDLEQLGTISRDELNRFVEEAQQRARQETDALDARIKEKVAEAARELGLATKEDIAEIKALLMKRNA